MNNIILWEEKNLIVPMMKLENNGIIVPNDITNEIKNKSSKTGCEDIGKIRKNYYVYYLIDPITNIPFYVGKGNGNRMYHHEWDVNKGKWPHNNRHLFYKIRKIIKSGKKIIYKKIIENIDEKEAFVRESNEIKNIGRSNSSNGPLCNITDGGEGSSGYKLSDETKTKIKIALRNFYNTHQSPNIGKKHSDETKSKLRILSSLRKHSEEEKRKISKANMGHGFSPETLLKMSLKKKGIPSKLKGIYRSKEIKEKISQSNNFRKKKIYQCNIDNNIIKLWNGISEAARVCNIQKSNIIKCLKNKCGCSMTGGYKWRYV